MHAFRPDSLGKHACFTARLERELHAARQRVKYLQSTIDCQNEVRCAGFAPPMDIVDRGHASFRVGKNMMDGVPQTNSFSADRTDSIQQGTGPMWFLKKTLRSNHIIMVQFTPLPWIILLLGPDSSKIYDSHIMLSNVIYRFCSARREHAKRQPLPQRPDRRFRNIGQLVIWRVSWMLVFGNGIPKPAVVWLINATRKPTHAPSGHVRRKVQKPSQRNWTILFFPAETPCLPRPSLAGISWAIFFLSMFVGFWACIKRPLWNHDMMLANDFQTQLWLWFACSCW